MSNKMLTKRPRAILFDLDGTLVDSAPDLTEALKCTFLVLDKQPHSEEKVTGWIGNGVDKLLHRALTDSMDGVASGDEFWRARKSFFAEYQKQSGNKSRLYHGVEKALEKLFQQGTLIACVTNKSRQFTLPLLEKLGIINYFNMVVCGDDLTNKKPHPEPIIFIANKLNIKVEDCLMVGDSVNDVKAANTAEMRIFCVDYGYSQGVNLQALKVDAMISDIREIESYFAEHSIKQCG